MKANSKLSEDGENIFEEIILILVSFLLEILDLHAVGMMEGSMMDIFDVLSRPFGMIFLPVEWIRKDSFDIMKRSKMKMIRPVSSASMNLLLRNQIRSYCSHVFAVFDRDHDGTIDFHEFLLAIAAGTPGDLDSHLKYVFDM